MEKVNDYRTRRTAHRSRIVMAKSLDTLIIPVNVLFTRGIQEITSPTVLIKINKKERRKS